MYVKALPATTYKELEEAFRGSNFSVYLIAIVSHCEVSCLVEVIKDIAQADWKQIGERSYRNKHYNKPSRQNGLQIPRYLPFRSQG